MRNESPHDIQLSGVSKRFGDKLGIAELLRHVFRWRDDGDHGRFGMWQDHIAAQILMGFLRVDGGRVSGVPHHQSAVFQEDRLCEDFSAVSNVRAVCGRRVSKEEITAHLARLGLAGSLSQPVRELSGGMRRRVAIARACWLPRISCFSMNRSRVWMRKRVTWHWLMCSSKPMAEP